MKTSFVYGGSLWPNLEIEMGKYTFKKWTHAYNVYVAFKNAQTKNRIYETGEKTHLNNT